jgi:hypothetical protein
MYEVHAELVEIISEIKGDLMIHRKKDHKERVGPCSFVMDGKCTFGDECWYSQKNDSSNILPEYKCKACKEVFNVKSELMKHRRHEHVFHCAEMHQIEVVSLEK